MRGIAICILIFLSGSAMRSQVSVSGTVCEEYGGLPLPNVTVKTGKTVVVSDSMGRFHFTTEKGRAIKLEFIHPSCQTQIRKLLPDSDCVMTVFIKSKVIQLGEVAVVAGRENAFGISRLNNIEGTTVYAGKKSEAIYVQDINANLAANNPRQIYSKIPGLNIFENDGTGASTNIGGRGLNPNRVSSFNTRQNGYDISADALGYPESYYTPPSEAIERIEILRGAAGLQFGTQFGGMINYKFAEALADRKISGNFRQSGGSFGALNSFNQLSGTVKKYSYNVFYQRKLYDGWRANSDLNSHTAHASLKFNVNEKLLLRAEYTFMNYIAQQPGGLTDAQFKSDNRIVTRSRNWFRVNWNLFALMADYKISDHTRMSLNTFALDAGRDALGFLGRADRMDDTSAFRNLLSDAYRNAGAELRFLHRYKFRSLNSHFLAGARMYRGLTDRKQGIAGKSSGPDFTFIDPADPGNSDYSFPSRNLAFFAENIFQISRRLSFTPGIRIENIYTSSDGYYRLLNTNLAGDTLLNLKVSDKRENTRSFALGGLGLQYKFGAATELYVNFTQNYRSINFNDMRVVNPSFQVDPELKDERGHTADGGIRGSLKDLLYFDAGVFLLKYNNRIGTALRVDSSTFQIIRFRTNIGESRNMGVEMFGELDWIKLIRRDAKHRLSTFVNFSAIHAVYTSDDAAYKNKRVEYVPDFICRSGITYGYGKFSFTLQYSCTGKQFSDATNATNSSSGIYGEIPAYAVADLSFSWSWKKWLINAGINNFLNAKYFTRRAEGYPGPGIIPADPRNGYLTLGYRF